MISIWRNLSRIKRINFIIINLWPREPNLRIESKMPIRREKLQAKLYRSESFSSQPIIFSLLFIFSMLDGLFYGLPVSIIVGGHSLLLRSIISLLILNSSSSFLRLLLLRRASLIFCLLSISDLGSIRLFHSHYQFYSKADLLFI